MTQHVSVIVVGCGGVGSAVLYHLARRGLSVLGIDRFGGAHDQGSSHGQTRAIRMAYFEHPNYVPLLQRAYALWRELERASNRPLFHEVGLIEIGPADGKVVSGVLASAKQHQLPVECWTHKQLLQRCPMFRVPESLEIVFERNAGYLLVEDCVDAHLAAATHYGAQQIGPAQVLQIDRQGERLAVLSDQGRFTADQLVVCGGPWASSLLPDSNLPLTVLSKPQYWFAPQTASFRTSQGCPVFFFEVDEGFYYGFPEHDERGVKVAQHHGGKLLRHADARSEEVDHEEQRQVIQFVERYVGGLRVPPVAHSVCMYTMTPDGHFLLDRHPQDPRIMFAAGLSGHGFKFTSVLGEILADWVEHGTVPETVEFLRANRPNLSGGLQ